jgi:hemerythrin superfamily protein
MNALELLALDHERISDLFDQLHESDQLEDKQDVFELLRDELTLHTQIEESIFYPTLREEREFEDFVAASLSDHQKIKDMLIEIESLEDEVELDSKLDELQDWVDQHVDQEENELFPRVRARIQEQKLEEMGLLMNRMKGGTAQAA